MGWIRDSGVKPESLTEYYRATVRGEVQQIHQPGSWGGDERGSFSTAVSNSFRDSLIENEHLLGPGARQLSAPERARLVGVLLRDSVIDTTDHYLAFSKGSYGKVAAGLVDRIMKDNLRSRDVTRVMTDPLTGTAQVPLPEDKALGLKSFANPTALFFQRMKKIRASKAWSDKRSRNRMIDASYEEVFPTKSRLLHKEDKLRNLRNQRQLRMLLHRTAELKARGLQAIDDIGEAGIYKEWTGEDFGKALQTAIHEQNTIMWQQVMNPERGRTSYYRNERKAFVAKSARMLARGKLGRHKQHFEHFDRQVKSLMATMNLAKVEPTSVWTIANNIITASRPKASSVSAEFSEIFVNSVKGLTKQQRQDLTEQVRALVTQELILPDGKTYQLSRLLEEGGWGIDLRAVYGMAFSEQMNIALDDSRMLRTRLRVYDFSGANDIDDPIAMQTAIMDAQDRDYVDQSLSVAASETALRWLRDEIAEKDNQGVDFSRKAWDYLTILGEMGEADALHFYKLHSRMTSSRPGGMRKTPTGALEQAPPELYNLLPLRLYPRAITPPRSR